jgi:hypothetical protein
MIEASLPVLADLIFKPARRRVVLVATLSLTCFSFQSMLENQDGKIESCVLSAPALAYPANFTG